MRLFLLPISTRRTLIYCQKIPKDATAKPSLADRATARVNDTWASWERADGGWKKTVTGWGNVLLRRIPFEEWGLKTIPVLSEKRRALEAAGQEKVEVLFPGHYLEGVKVPRVLERLATERQGLHRQKMIYSMIGAPLTLPFALVPVIPNLPGFYLVFRAWSHWKALRGGQHLEWLVANKLTIPKTSPILDELYTAGLMYSTRQESREAPAPTQQQCIDVSTDVRDKTSNDQKEVLLLKRWNGKLLAEQFKLPEMEVEIERAVEQVEASIESQQKSGADGGAAEKSLPSPASSVSEKSLPSPASSVLEKDTQ